MTPPSLKSDRDRRGGQCAWGGSNFGTIDHPAASIKAVCVSELNGLPPSRSAAEIEGGVNTQRGVNAHGSVELFQIVNAGIGWGQNRGIPPNLFSSNTMSCSGMQMASR